MASKILKGIATLFQRRAANPAAKDVVDTDPSEVQQVFQQNLIDTFGEAEVKEGLRIIGNKSNNPELEKLFYKPGETLEDELVNLLETRYMGSERLQAHPLNFNRRGPGAADRYLKINDSGMRLTDLPGGPADKKLYSEFYGNMSGTTRMDGSKVYSNPASILDEDKLLADAAETIDGTLVEDSLYDNSIADIPLINRIMKESGKTETEVRESIINLANDGYDIGDPKRMRTTDDDRIRAYVSNRETIPGDREDFVTDLMEDLDVPTESKLNLMGANEIESKLIREMENMRDEARAMTEINMAEQTEVSQIMDAFKRLIDDGEDPVEATKFLQDALKRTTTKQKDGGRVHAAFGKFIGEGIMQAARLANKGIKPFGQKQTYKQKMDIRGVSNDQFNEILKKQLNRVPDEVSDEATGRGLYQSLLEAEAIITGQKLGLLTQAQRTKIATAMTKKVSKQIYDNPVSGLNNDYLEYMDDAIGRMDAILEIEKLGGDLTPKPIYDGKEIIAAGIDFSQLDKLGKKTNNVIPFKPREKKYSGGIAGILRQLLRRSGMSAPDKVADKKQIQNVIRDPNTELERRYVEGFDGTPPTPANRMTIDEIRDMVQKDPRYDKLTAKQMDEVIIKETIRADFAYNMGMKAEDVGDDIVEMLYRERYQNRFGFIQGGIVNTLAAPNATQAQQNAMTNQDLFAKINSPYTQEVMRANQEAMANPMRYQLMEQYMNSPAFKEAQERSQQFQLRQNEANHAMRMGYMRAEQGLADTYAGMDDFQQVGIGLDKKMENLGRVLGMGQQKIQQQIAQANPNQPQTGLQSQNVLNIGGLGNLFGLRS